MPIAARRRNKPNPGVGIDLRHPLAAGLVGAWTINEGCGPVVYNAVRSRNVNNGILQTGAAAPAWTSGRSGAALSMLAASAQYVNCGRILELDGARQVTLFAVGARAASKNWIVGRSSGSADRVSIFVEASNDILLILDNGTLDGWGQGVATAPTGDFSASLILDTFQSVAANRLVGFVNGRRETYTPSGGGFPATGGVIPTSSNPWYIGYDAHTPVATDGRCDVVFLWAGRALDATEIGDLHDDPWQLFQSPRIFSLYRGAAATVGGSTLSGTTGVYSLSGNAAGLLAGQIVGADVGHYLLTGQDAGPVYTPVGAYVVSAGTGVYGLAGQAAGLVGISLLAASTGVYTLAGQAAAFIYSGDHVPVYIDPEAITEIII